MKPCSQKRTHKRVLFSFKRIVCTLFSAAALLIFYPVCSDADPIRFFLPVDCSVGKNCFIQNYFDHRHGPGRKDYACGFLTYDGHGGTDFRLKNYPAMHQGTEVIAAAPGTVLRTRDGMPDININEINSELIKGREAGNAVIIDHGRGWVTQYSHLLKGSVAVKPGMRVKKGEKLGLVGLSGKTEFPHVEFTVRYKGKKVDPFQGLKGFQECGDTAQALWADKALQVLAYRKTGCLSSGFALEVPEAENARKGMYGKRRLEKFSKVLIFWVDLFGVIENDIQIFELRKPGGTRLMHHSKTVKASKVAWFSYAGLKQPRNGWDKGVYKAVYTLRRQGKNVIRLLKTIECNRE